MTIRGCCLPSNLENKTSMSSGYGLVSIFLYFSVSLGFWMVLVFGAATRAAAAAITTAYAGGLVADPVSDNSIRFHERTHFLLLQIIPFFLHQDLVARGWMTGCSSQPIRVQGLFWIRRQRLRLSGCAHGSDNIMVLLRWTDCFEWRVAWGRFPYCLA